MVLSPELPFIYIIPGSWHTPRHFDVAIERLNALGYEVVCPLQPSNGLHSGKLSMYDDAAMTRASIERLIKPKSQGGQGRDVAVVMHSYGGMVGTEACAGLGKADRAPEQTQPQSRDENDRAGSVVSLLYAAAFMLPVGYALSTPFGGGSAPFILQDDAMGLGRPHLLPQAPTAENPQPEPIKTTDAPMQLFYNDLPPDEAKYYSSLILPQSFRTQHDPLTRAAWTGIPASYLFCEDDQVLQSSIQKTMVEVANQFLSSAEDGETVAKMPKVQEFTCTAGHSPFLSQPDLFVDVVIKSIR